MLLLAGLSKAELSYVLLSGFKLPSPGSPQHGLVPEGLLGAGAGGTLKLRDVRILVDAPTLKQHVDFIKQLPDVTTYTVSSTQCTGS